jgi:hypothetical protein
MSVVGQAFKVKRSLSDNGRANASSEGCQKVTRHFERDERPTVGHGLVTEAIELTEVLETFPFGESYRFRSVQLLEDKAATPDAEAQGRSGKSAPITLASCFEVLVQAKKLDNQKKWFCPHYRQFLQFQKSSLSS